MVKKKFACKNKVFGGDPKNLCHKKLIKIYIKQTKKYVTNLRKLFRSQLIY